jgi:hypothetical protein
MFVFLGQCFLLDDQGVVGLGWFLQYTYHVSTMVSHESHIVIPSTWSFVCLVMLCTECEGVCVFVMTSLGVL